MIDPNGTKYSPDIGASGYYAAEVGTETKVLSDLNPGIQIRNVTVFEISKATFNPATWSILVNADQDVTIKFQ